MGVSVDLLPLTTVMGDDDITEVVQEVCESMDTSKHSTGVITARSVYSDGVRLIAEGSDDGQSFIVVNLGSEANITSVTGHDTIRVNLGPAVFNMGLGLAWFPIQKGQWVQVTVEVTAEHAGTAVLPNAFVIDDRRITDVAPPLVCPRGIRNLRISGSGFFREDDGDGPADQPANPLVSVDEELLNPEDVAAPSAAPPSFPLLGLDVDETGHAIDLVLPWDLLPAGMHDVSVLVQKHSPGLALLHDAIELTDLQVVSIEPSAATYLRPVTFTIRGSGFTANSSFYLVNRTGTEVKLGQHELVDSTEVRATATLQVVGTFDLEVRLPNGSKGAPLEGAVDIQAQFPRNALERALDVLVAVGKPVGSSSGAPFVSLPVWPRNTALPAELPLPLEFEMPFCCGQQATLNLNSMEQADWVSAGACLVTVTSDLLPCCEVGGEAQVPPWCLWLVPGKNVELYDLGSRPVDSLGNGFLWYVRKSLETKAQGGLSFLGAPASRLGIPTELLVVEPVMAFEGTDKPVTVLERTAAVAHRDPEGNLLRVGVLGVSCNGLEQRALTPNYRFAMRWERPAWQRETSFDKQVTLTAAVTHEVLRVLGMPIGVMPLRTRVRTRVQLTAVCSGTSAPRVEWFFVQDGSSQEVPITADHMEAGTVENSAGVTLFQVLASSDPDEPCEPQPAIQGQMLSFAPCNKASLLLSGPVGLEKLSGQFFCRVTSEWGDFDMTSNAVEVDFVSELSTDLSHKKVVPQKQFPTPGDFGLGEGVAGPGGLPAGWQDAPKEPVQWMGPGEDPVPTDMQTNMQETVDPVLGKGKMGL